MFSEKCKPHVTIVWVLAMSANSLMSRYKYNKDLYYSERIQEPQNAVQRTILNNQCVLIKL